MTVPYFGIFFFTHLVIQVNIRACGAFGESLGVIFEPLGLLGHEPFEVLDEYSPGAEELLHGARPAERQIAFEDDPVEAGDHALSDVLEV